MRPKTVTRTFQLGVFVVVPVCALAHPAVASVMRDRSSGTDGFTGAGVLGLTAAPSSLIPLTGAPNPSGILNAPLSGYGDLGTAPSDLAAAFLPGINSTVRFEPQQVDDTASAADIAAVAFPELASAQPGDAIQTDDAYEFRVPDAPGKPVNINCITTGDDPVERSIACRLGGAIIPGEVYGLAGAVFLVVSAFAGRVFLKSRRARRFTPVKHRRRRRRRSRQASHAA